ncbi:MAG: Rab family GTPase [Candidatus Heimdallarchaeota archaeon]
MLIIKISLLGDGAVGKTSLRRRFMGEGFDESYQLTIGADFASKEVTLSDGRPIRFQIWDLAGQTHFESVRSMYFKGTMGAMVVYDVTRPLTYESLDKWCQDFWTLNGAGPRPIVTLGNKSDLIGNFSLPTVSSSKGRDFAEKIGSQREVRGVNTAYFDTSARTGLNVTRAFIRLGDFIIEYMRRNPEYAPPTGI